MCHADFTCIVKFKFQFKSKHTSKLAPRWKGSYRVHRIPNEYQVLYEDGKVERTIHVNHAKPAKFTAPDFPEPVPPTETPRPPLGYLPRVSLADLLSLVLLLRIIV